MLFLCLLLTAAASTLQYFWRYGVRTESAIAAVENLRSAQTPALLSSLWSSDTDQLRILVEGMGLFPYVNYLSVSDLDGRIFFTGGMKSSSRAQRFSLTYPYGGREIPLGTLELQIDTQKLARDVRSEILQSLGVQAVLMVLASLLVFLLFERMVTRHLVRIAAHVDGFVPGKVRAPLLLDKRPRGDELEILAASFHSLEQGAAEARADEMRAMEELRESEEAVRRSLREKETLLQEVYHRTKNNMQVIASLLEMQSLISEDEGTRNVMKEMVGRIKSMALVHRKLYESKDLSRIDLGEYIEDLASGIRSSFLDDRKGIEIMVDAARGIVSLLDTAIPCGLALNELVVNSVKHAFPGGRKGSIRVRLRRQDDGAIELTVADDGIGLPPGFDAERDGRLGLRTVVSLIEYQLHGTVEHPGGEGTTWVVVFRDGLYEARV